MIITLNLAGEIPLYQQIRDQIVTAIAQGRLFAGNALPSVRQLALEIGVNMHTVNKAYSLLRDDGYLIIDRRSGARVADHLPVDDAALSRMRTNLDTACTEAHSRGMTKDAFLALCGAAFDSLTGESL